MICNNCSSVQLKGTYNKNYLFSDGYGYRTGINNTMINHMKTLKKNIEQKIRINSSDSILDSK